MSDLIQSWLNCSLTVPPYLLPADKEQIDIEQGALLYHSYEEYIASKDFEAGPYKFHLGLIPQPYIGNLDTSTVYLLMLNPGFSAGDYYAQQHCPAFRAARERNLRQANKDDDYPFFYLDPAFSWTAGGQWWQSKLRSITEELMSKKSLTRQQALQHISHHLACLELCPYHSKQYASASPKLESSKLIQEYVKKEILAKAERDAALIVVMRQIKAWGLISGDNVICFEGGQARGAHITMNTEAGRRICEVL